MLDCTTYKALMAIVWQIQDEHGLDYPGALRTIDGDPSEVLEELRVRGLPLSRADLRKFIRTEERSFVIRGLP